MRFNATKIASQINANVVALDAGEISFDEFNAVQRTTWDSVSLGALNIHGSACAKRHHAVLVSLGIAKS